MFVTTRRDTYNPVRLSELDYESLVVDIAPLVMPAWQLVRWKKRVYASDGRGGVEADAVLLSTVSDEWFIVEVELARHSIEGHVAPQLDRLARAQYPASLAGSIASASGRPEPDIRRMLRQTPDFLCLADDYTAQLAEACTAAAFQFAVLAPYRAPSGQSALRVVRLPGQLSDPPQQSASSQFHLRRSDQRLLGATTYELPENFPAVPEIRLYVDDAIQMMRVTQVAGRRLMFVQADAPLPREPAVLKLIPRDDDDGTFRIARSIR